MNTGLKIKRLKFENSLINNKQLFFYFYILSGTSTYNNSFS